MSEKLLVVGSIALDDLQTSKEKRKDVLGGAATYISVAASRFCPVNLVGVIGDDFPEEHVDLLESRKVDLAGVEKAKGKTFRWSGVYADDFSSRETLDTQLGVFETFSPKIPEAYRKNRFVMLGNIHPGLQLKVLEELLGSAFVAADTMNLWIDTTPAELNELISKVDLLVLNDEESVQLTGEQSVIRAAAAIREMGPKMVVVKRGEHGAWLFSDVEPFFAPALPLEQIVDPTGAGDSFAGGMMGYIASQGIADIDAIKKGMIYGAAVASHAVEGFGADYLAGFRMSDIEKRVDRLQRLVSLN